MNMVKILHCADQHIGALDSFLGSSAAARRYETIITFEKTIDVAKDNNVQLMAIAGDLFDSNKVESSLVDAVLKAITEANDIKFVYAAGNHDPLNEESPFKNRELPENLFILDTKDDCITFDDLKVRIYGRSFPSGHMRGEETFSLVPRVDEFINIMVIHGELKSDLNSEYNAITPKFVKNSKMDYIALGHIHKCSPIGKIGTTSFAYCGCPEGQGFDELEEKGVYVGTISRYKCDMKFVTVSKRIHAYEKIDITGLSSTEEISDRIISFLKEKYEDNYSNNLYKIDLTGIINESTNLSIPEIRARLSCELYFVKVNDETEFEIDIEALSSEKSLKGIFVKNMIDRYNKANDTDRLLIKKAMKLALKSFNSEVSFDEN